MHTSNKNKKPSIVKIGKRKDKKHLLLLLLSSLQHPLPHQHPGSGLSQYLHNQPYFSGTSPDVSLSHRQTDLSLTATVFPNYDMSIFVNPPSLHQQQIKHQSQGLHEQLTWHVGPWLVCHRRHSSRACNKPPSLHQQQRKQ